MAGLRIAAGLRGLASELARWPVLFHCTSGKDRFGVVVAALLTVLGIERQWVVQEYLLSDGGVAQEWIEGALDGIGDPAAYFRRVDLGALRRKLLAPEQAAAPAASRCRQ